MSGFENDVVFAKNADFTQADNQLVSESNGLFLDGQIWIGRTAVNAGGTHIDVARLTPGAGIGIANGPGSITITNTAPPPTPTASLAPWIVGDAFQNYSTIQAAINAAVLLSPSESAQINIYIKAMGTDYVENLTLADGVNLIGFDPSSLGDYVGSDNVNAVTIVGTHTIPGDLSGRAKFSNIEFEKDDGVIFAFADSVSQSDFTIEIVSATIFADNDDDPAYVISGGAFTNPTLIFTDSLLVGGGAFFEDSLLDTDFIGCTINMNYSHSALGESSTASKGVFLIQGELNYWDSCTFALTGTATLSFYETNTSFNTINVSADTLSDSAITNCYIRLGQFNINAGSRPVFTGCAFNPNFPLTYGGTLQPVLEDCSGTSGYAKETTTQTLAYTTLVTDNFVPVDVSGAPVTISMFATPFSGMQQIIMDSGGDAATNALTIAGNGHTINGAATYVINTNYGSATLEYDIDSTEWKVIANGQIGVASVVGGPGVTVTNSGSTYTVNSTIFTDTTAATLAVDNGYFATAAGTYPMPATAAQGELITVVCDTAGAVVLDCPAANFIRIGSLITSSGGTVTSTSIGDSLTLRYRLSSLTWECTSCIGTWLVA